MQRSLLNLQTRIRNVCLGAILALGASPLAISSAFAEPKVVTTIKPVHSIVSAVMKGAGEPELLIDGITSPHNFSLKPSQARLLSEADLIVWTSGSLESFMPKALEELAANAKSLELEETENIKLLPFRDLETWKQSKADDHDHKHEDDHAEKHDEHDHGDDHAEHKEDKHDEHGHDEHDHDKHDHDEHAEKHDEHDHGDDHAEHKEDKDDHGHDHHDHSGANDPHLWLAPENARVMAFEIAKALSTADPENTDLYQKNAEAFVVKLSEAEMKIAEEISAATIKPYIVFHDAYQYFEQRFDLKPSATINVSPEISPGAAHMQFLRGKISEAGEICLFYEPQFPPTIVDSLADAGKVVTAELDPLGVDIEAGPDHYLTLVQSISRAILSCKVSG